MIPNRAMHQKYSILKLHQNHVIVHFVTEYLSLEVKTHLPYFNKVLRGVPYF